LLTSATAVPAAAPAVVDDRLFRLGPLTRRKILSLPLSEREAAVSAALNAVEWVRARVATRVAAVRTDDTAEAA
jgi:hypothetical protein